MAKIIDLESASGVLSLNGEAAVLSSSVLCTELGIALS
jgi:hypothetical protein